MHTITFWRLWFVFPCKFFGFLCMPIFSSVYFAWSHKKWIHVSLQEMMFVKDRLLYLGKPFNNCLAIFTRASFCSYEWDWSIHLKLIIIVNLASVAMKSLFQPFFMFWWSCLGRRKKIAPLTKYTPLWNLFTLCDWWKKEIHCSYKHDRIH